MVLALILIALLALVVFGIFCYNKLAKLNVQVDEAESGIDVALKRRADLIPNLVSTVKGYAAHEAGTLAAVTEARSATLGAKSFDDKVAADSATTAALMNLFAVSEAYPDLKAVDNFVALQEELTSTENRIAFSRQNYNGNAAALNTAASTVPCMFFAGLAKVTKRPFWEVDSPTDRENPTVSF